MDASAAFELADLDALGQSALAAAGEVTEAILLKLAAQLETALPWADRRPLTWVGG